MSEVSLRGSDKANQIDFSSAQKTKEQWLHEGSILYRENRYHELLTACEWAIQMDENYARAHLAKGLVLIGLRLYEEAIGALQQAASINPQNASIYLALGSAFFKGFSKIKISEK